MDLIPVSVYKKKGTYNIPYILLHTFMYTYLVTFTQKHHSRKLKSAFSN